MKAGQRKRETIERDKWIVEAVLGGMKTADAGAACNPPLKRQSVSRILRMHGVKSPNDRPSNADKDEERFRLFKATGIWMGRPVSAFSRRMRDAVAELHRLGATEIEERGRA